MRSALRFPNGRPEFHPADGLLWRTFGRQGRPDSLPICNRRRTRALLESCLNQLGVKEGVEIGTRLGGSAVQLFKAIPELHLTCVDPWMAYKSITQAKQDYFYQKAQVNLAPYNATILRTTSMGALPNFLDQSLDFVLIDGAHDFDFCCPDIIFWAQKVRPGGIVMVHDYCEFRWAGIVKAVNAYTHCHHIDPWYVTRDPEPTAFWVNP